MGWSTGSDLFAEIAESIERHVHDEQIKINIYYEIISSFEDYDADTLEECLGISDALDSVLKEVYNIDDPDKDEDEDLWDGGGRENFG
jgi:hypothetical protein